jgi:hypothetical protein
VKSRARTKGLMGRPGLSAGERRERERARLTSGVGRSEGRRRDASAGGRVGDGPRGPGGERGVRGRGEKVGPDSAQPRGDFPFSFYFLLSFFLFLFLFLLSPLSFEQIFSYIFLGVKKIFYVRCY